MSSTVERKTPAERSAEIAEAARDLALEHGLSALTLRSVAARARVAPGLVAHYSSTMDELVAATFTRVARHEIDEVRALVDADADASERLAHLLATMLDERRRDVTVIWVEAWGLGRRNDHLAAAVRREMDAWHAVVRAVIDAGESSGEFSTDDSAATAWQLLGMVDGLNAQALVRWEPAGEQGALLAQAVEGMLGLSRGSLRRSDSRG